jgi:hypothetical protein
VWVYDKQQFVGAYKKKAKWDVSLKALSSAAKPQWSVFCFWSLKK